MNLQKTPDRLYNSTEANKIIAEIDNNNLLGLNKSNVTRAKLFMFAMSLGIETNIVTPLKNIYQGGFIRSESIDPQANALLHAFYLSTFSNPYEEIDMITNKQNAFKLAEEYANTGFKIMEDYLTQNEEHLILSLLEEIQEGYEKIMADGLL